MRSKAIRILLLLAVAQGCTGPKEPYEGEYDVTATFETFQWETSDGSGFPPSECPPQGYCEHSRPFSGATLSGVLKVRQVKGSSPNDSLSASGIFSGNFCSNTYYLTGCTGVALRSDAYDDYGSAISPTGVMRVSVRKSGAQPISSEGPVINLAGSFAGDEFSGTVGWYGSVGRGPDAHQGHFVARKRR
jgi:hypothetical protein